MLVRESGKCLLALYLYCCLICLSANNVLHYQFAMNDNNCIVFNWNVRGLNGAARRHVVKGFVADHGATIICLQETKLQHVDD